MKIPVSLQYALTRGNNRYLLKNLNREVFTKDPANTFGRNTAMDLGWLRKRSVYPVTSKDGSTVLVATKLSRGRITKRRGKKSGLTSKVVTVGTAEYDGIKSLGKKVCVYELWKINRAKKALKRGKRLAATAEENN